MNEAKITEQLMEISRALAALQEKVSSAHKRIDENDRITEGIHEIASNVAALTLQVKNLTESMGNSIERLETSLRNQGERIGTLEREPGTKWKQAGAQVTAIIIAAVMGFILSKIGG